jgi:hypothetical protein
VIDRGDLFLSFMRGRDTADDGLPRFGVWRSDDRAAPEPIELKDAGRDWLAAIGLPAVFRRRGVSERAEGTIRAGMTDRVDTTGDELDDLMQKNAELHNRPSGAGARRSRGKDNAINGSRAAGHSIERHLDMRGATQGRWALDGVRTDVDLLLAAVDEERWADARRILEVVASPTWTGPVTTGDISAVEVPADHITDPTARRMLDAAIRSAADHRPPGRRRPPASVAAGMIAIVAVVAIATGVFGQGGGPTLSAHARALRAHGRVLTVSNLVTSGRHMTEDPLPAVLSTRPQPVWGTVSGSKRSTGGRYDAAVCQINGLYDTNGDDGSKLDDRDPDLARSHLYYGVLLPDGRFGFTSDVWVVKSERGGLGLPRCDGDRPPG